MNCPICDAHLSKQIFEREIKQYEPNEFKEGKFNKQQKKEIRTKLKCKKCGFVRAIMTKD